MFLLKIFTNIIIIFNVQINQYRSLVFSKSFSGINEYVAVIHHKAINKIISRRMYNATAR